MPDASFWLRGLTSSRLLEYETINRLLARGSGPERLASVNNIMDGVELLDLSPAILARALEPFPIPVRSLDGLHLATMHYLRGRGQPLQLATYDMRFAAAAQALGFPLAEI